MPIPLALAAAAIPAITDLVNSGSTLYTNAQNRQFSQQMYDRQRADALTDWDKQNKYNSPSQQMQRYKEAGLNPNLIYGQMSNSAAIRSTDMKHPDFVAPKLQNTGQVMNNYVDFKLKEQQLSNDKQAGDLLREQTRGKRLENENLIDSSPYLLEEKFQRSRLVGEQVQNIMADIRNKEVMNPLQQDKLRSELTTLQANRKYQALDYDQKVQMNNVLKQSLNQAMKIQGNRYELDKLTNELENSLRRKVLFRGQEQQEDVIKSAKDIMQLFYEPTTYGNQFLK
jgi:hypothetical protein